MKFSLTWLPNVLLEAGLKVAIIPGWEERGRREMGRVLGVICHHTAGPRSGNMPSLRTLIDGRPETQTQKALPGPLSQLGLGRDGTYYIIAAGRCNHAGEGIWKGVTNGNGNFIGIEAENTGMPNDFPWPHVQLDAYHRGVAAILKHIGKGADFCAGHREFARPAGRKPDPNLDMTTFRESVDAILERRVPPPELIPSSESINEGVGRATVRRGSNNKALIQAIQAKIKILEDGNFGPATEAAVRAFQRRQGLVPDGIVGPKTWSALDAATT